MQHLVAPAALAGVVQTLVLGAEALRGEMLQTWQAAAPRTRLLNEYGPTETVVGCSSYLLPPGPPPPGPVPIGLPIANTQLYALNPQLQPVPIGVVGELYIGGAGVAWGYQQRPRQTAAQFVPDPFSALPGARLYRTGDLVRVLAQRQANLEFIGRGDDQVKIRGYRVELAEVEAVLAQHPAVREVVVLARAEAARLRLVGYLVSRAGQAPALEELRGWLQERLPEYMVPEVLVLLEQLPLTATGKLDRQALRARELERPALATGYVAPRSELEALLAGLWAEVLRLERVGIHDNFFALGGHSLLLTHLVARIREVLRVELPLRTLFDAPTIASLAIHIETISWAIQGEEASSNTTVGSREEFMI